MVSLFCFLHACYNFIKIFMKQPALHICIWYIPSPTIYLVTYVPNLNENYVRICN